MTQTIVDQESEEWAQARKRVNDRRDFGSHVVAYVVVNAFLTLVWAVTSAGYFWPAWPLLGLTIAAVFAGLDAYGITRRTITESDVEAEIARMNRKSGGGTPAA